MPNYCYNAISVSKSDAEALKHLGTKEWPTIDFNTLIPMPPNGPDFCGEDLTAEMKQKFPQNNWYDWSISHWGTKWNACDVNFRETDTEVILSFSTAWAPPLPVIEALSLKYPEVLFTYRNSEESNAFATYKQYKNGLVTQELDLPCDNSVEAILASYKYLRDYVPVSNSPYNWTFSKWQDLYTQAPELLQPLYNQILEHDPEAIDDMSSHEKVALLALINSTNATKT